MFEEMMKYEKAWIIFAKWLKKKYNVHKIYIDDTWLLFTSIKYKNYGYDHVLEDDFILSIMPFFFDEYGISIDCNRVYYNEKYGILFNPTIIDKKKLIFLSDYPFNKTKIRQKAIIKACIKAFEILNKQLEEGKIL